MDVLLLDAYNLLFRSFTSLPDSITDTEGRPINAVYGMLSTIVRLIKDLGPDHIVAAFDTPEVATFRHRLYPGYQGQRGPLGGEQAEDFALQVTMARQALPAVGVAVLASPGFEADDVIGTLAARIASSSGHARVVSTDRDLTQLIRPGVEILIPGSVPRHILTEADVVDLVGVPPAGVPTFKALAGDPSDNIPGVRGIGKVTAIDLVNRFSSLEAIYDALDALPARVSARLAENRDEAFLYRTVATVVTDLDLGVDVRLLPPLAIDAETRPRAILAQSGPDGGART